VTEWGHFRREGRTFPTGTTLWRGEERKGKRGGGREEGKRGKEAEGRKVNLVWWREKRGKGREEREGAVPPLTILFGWTCPRPQGTVAPQAAEAVLPFEGAVGNLH
jgi:hypothetical protein